MASAAPIELDVCGRPRTIHFSPRLDFVPLLPPADLSAYYRARREFDQDTETAQLRPGAVVEKYLQ